MNITEMNNDFKFSIRIQGSGTSGDIVESLEEIKNAIAKGVEINGESHLDGFFYEDETLLAESEVDEDDII